MMKRSRFIKIILISIIFIICRPNNALSSDWNYDTRITYNDSISSNSVIAVYGTNIHVVWNDHRDGFYEIYYKKSNDNGESWSSDIRLSANDGSDSFSPQLAVNGYKIHIVWQDSRDGFYGIYYKRSNDNGESWSSDIRLSANDGSGSGHPAIAVNGDKLHVVWMDSRDGNDEIYYKRSNDNGESWSSDIRLSANDGSDSSLPKIAVSGNNTHVVWGDKRDGVWEVYYRRSTNNGENWGIELRLSANVESFWLSKPAIAVSGNNIHVVWDDDRDLDDEIFYKRSSDNGESWSSEIMITTNDGLKSEFPAIAVNGDVIHIVWNDKRDVYDEIYYKRSNDNGENWNSNYRISSGDGSASYIPSVALNGNDIHVVWSDIRDGNYEIYYKQKLNQKPTVDTLDLSANHVYLKDVVYLYANASDDNNKESDLTPSFEYKHISESIWYDNCIFDVEYDFNGWYWKASFSMSEDLDIGFYDFRVKFYDTDGLESDWKNGLEQVDVMVHPVCIVSVSSTEVNAGENIIFNASLSVGKDLIYYFDFGDGVIIDWGYDAVRTHKFSSEGIYIVKVKVKDTFDEESLWNSIEITVTKFKSNDDSTPGFELIIFLFSIAFIIFWKRKR
jgi:hypothetical protein